MEKTILLALMEFTKSMAGNQHLHPPVDIEAQLAPEVRHRVLFEDQDRLLEHIPAYKSEIMPKGSFEKDWYEEATLPQGFLAELVRTTVKRYQEVGKQQVDAFAEKNLSRVDRALAKHVAHMWQSGYGYFLRKKTDLMGRLPPQQGDLLATLKAMNHLRSLQFTWQMADYSCDRLVGYGIRMAALDTCVIPPKDKLHVQSVMTRFQEQDNQELKFWSDCYLNLRKLYNEMIHMTSVYHLMDYQQRTIGSLDKRVMLQIDKCDQEALYGEAIVSFRRYVCSQRTPGFISRVVEYTVNGLVGTYVKEIGAKDPRPFHELLALIKEKSARCYSTIVGYEEATPFDGKAKAYECSSAIFNDYWHVAYQIAQNGKRANNKDFDWEKVIVDLRQYQDFVHRLIFVSYELFKIRCKLALRLTNKDEWHLNKNYTAVQKAEYHVQQALINLRMSYHNSLLSQLDRTNQYWAQLKSMITGQVTRYLLENKFREKTTPYDTETITVQAKLLEIHQLIDRLLPTMDELQPSRQAKSITQELPTNVQHQRRMPAERKVLPKLSESVSTLASREELDLSYLLTYTRFKNGDAYKTFIAQQKFMEDRTIRAAIVFCKKNIEEGIPGWQWAKESDELFTLHRFVEHLGGLSDHKRPAPPSTLSVSSAASAAFSLAGSLILLSGSSTPTTPSSDSKSMKKKSPAEILELLWQSFKKKVDTDYSVLQWEEAEAEGRIAKLRAGASLGYQSIWRKYERRTITNDAPNWRDIDFLRGLELELGLAKAESVSAAEMEKMMEGWIETPGQSSDPAENNASRVGPTATDDLSASIPTLPFIASQDLPGTSREASQIRHSASSPTLLGSKSLASADTSSQQSSPPPPSASSAGGSSNSSRLGSLRSYIPSPSSFSLSSFWGGAQNQDSTTKAKTE